MKRFGGIGRFRVAGGEQQAVDVCGRAEVFTLGESLGGVECLIEHPGRMTHASVAGTAARGAQRPDPAQRRHRDGRRPARRPRPCPRLTRRATAICVDFGSTFTKAALVDLAEGRIVGPASHRTTIDTDVLDGYDACLAALREQDPRADDAEVLACSSAGGGLRIAVVGNEELVTAEAGRRVALSSGGRVVHGARRLDAGPTCAAAARRAAPDVVLLIGGTDGGNAEVLARRGPGPGEGRLGRTRRGRRQRRRPAPRCEAALDRDAVRRRRQRGAADRRARARTRPARAIREMFLSHVIGGKHLSSAAPTSPRWSRGATPDVVLTGVEVLASRPARRRRRRRRGRRDHRRALGGRARPGGGDPVPRGGRHHARHPDRRGRPRHALVGHLDRRGRDRASTTWRPRAEVRHADPGFLPTTDAEYAEDEAHRRRGRRARAAVGTPAAARSWSAPTGRVVERTGKDLREVDLLVGSGGVLRHGRPGVAERVLGGSAGEVEGGWQLPRATAGRGRPRLRARRRRAARRRATPRRRTGSCSDWRRPVRGAPPARGTPRRRRALACPRGQRR